MRQAGASTSWVFFFSWGHTIRLILWHLVAVLYFYIFFKAIPIILFLQGKKKLEMLGLVTITER